LKKTTPIETKNSIANTSFDIAQIFNIEFLFFIAFIAVHFMPDMGTQDPINFQWLYMSLVDVFVFGYVLMKVNSFKNYFTPIFKSIFFLIYAVLLLWISFSYLYATNSVEVLVTGARFVSTFFAFISISLILSRKVEWIQPIMALLVGALLVESFNTIKAFNANLNDFSLDQNIIELRGLNGNKNVMAASIMIKIPFCIYFIYSLKNKIYKGLTSIILFLALLSIFILNTRSTFVSLIAITILYSVYQFFYQYRQSTLKAKAFNYLFFIIPLVFSIISSTQMLNAAKELPQNAGQGYGTVAARISTIKFTDEGSSARLRLWREALDYTLKHPFIGCGFGNWKLESIPYETDFANEADVPYHCHNDFLEISTEIGIPGFLLYISLFVVLTFYTGKILLKSPNDKIANLVFISFLALVAYSFDALLNFPSERTIIQTIFAFIISFIFVLYHFGNTADKKLEPTSTSSKQLYTIVFLLFIIPSIYLNYNSFVSSQAQRTIFPELSLPVPQLPLDQVENAFPSTPNLSYSTIPIKGALSRYYIREKQYDKAMELIKQSRKDNPYLGYDYYLMTSYYASKGMPDSALYFAKKTYFLRPRAMAYYQNLVTIAAMSRDSTTIDSAFNTFVKFRNEAPAWATYIRYNIESRRRIDSRVKLLADSAMKLFPNDSAIIKAKDIAYQPLESIEFIKQAFISFNNKDYATSAANYLKAIPYDPNNFANYENVGLCYYASNMFKEAIPYFDKAISFKACVSGKSAFFRGICLINAGRKPEGCASFVLAQKQEYPQALDFYNNNCIKK
jgi:O-antigen ligase/tetratricopeptide (TPR) repeat protein